MLGPIPDTDDQCVEHMRAALAASGAKDAASVGEDFVARSHGTVSVLVWLELAHVYMLLNKPGEISRCRQAAAEDDAFASVEADFYRVSAKWWYDSRRQSAIAVQHLELGLKRYDHVNDGYASDLIAMGWLLLLDGREPDAQRAFSDAAEAVALMSIMMEPYDAQLFRDGRWGQLLTLAVGSSADDRNAFDGLFDECFHLFQYDEWYNEAHRHERETSPTRRRVATALKHIWTVPRLRQTLVRQYAKHELAKWVKQ